MAEKQKQQQMKEVDDEQGGGDLLLMGFNLLPEDCISTILSFTSPRDVFRSSLVSTIFKSAAESDSVWDNFLPSIYPEIISRSSSSSSSSTTTTSLLDCFSSKKDLYCRLSDKPVLIDGGLKSFGVEKGSGKICLGIGARDLSIIWGSSPEYWAWKPSSSYDSRFPEVAKLLSVWWFEITGKVETRMLSPKTTYGAYFVIKIAEYNYGLDRVPIQSSMRFVRGGGECSGERKMFLGSLEGRSRQQGEYFLHNRGDGWMEIEMGEFYNDGEEDGEVEMHLLETVGICKSGLIVQGMELRPKVQLHSIEPPTVMGGPAPPAIVGGSTPPTHIMRPPPAPPSQTMRPPWRIPGSSSSQPQASSSSQAQDGNATQVQSSSQGARRGGRGGARGGARDIVGGSTPPTHFMRPPPVPPSQTMRPPWRIPGSSSSQPQARSSSQAQDGNATQVQSSSQGARRGGRGGARAIVGGSTPPTHFMRPSPVPPSQTMRPPWRIPGSSSSQPQASSSSQAQDGNATQVQSSSQGARRGGRGGAKGGGRISKMGSSSYQGGLNAQGGRGGYVCKWF